MNPHDLYTSVGPSVDGPMPLLVLTEGWLEASETIERVHETIVHQSDLTTLAEFDTDQLLDQRTRRPILTVVDGVTQGVTWPELKLSVGTDRNDRPFLLVHGPEPDFCWRPFAKAVSTLTSAIGVSTTYTFGAYPAPVPHTRAQCISSTASDAEMLIGRDHTTGQIVVPVGVFAAITEELEPFGIPTHSLYAQVPYYLSTGPWPQAAIGMFNMLGQVAGLHFDTEHLEAQVDEAMSNVEAMIEDTPSLLNVVAGLEKRHDELQKFVDGNLPNGDELEEELQQYLRKIDGD